MYLVILITKLNAFEWNEDGGDVSIFATVEWGGNVKTTKSIKKPSINETIYFHLPIEEDMMKDSYKLAEFLKDELETKSEVVFNVWADTGKPYL